MELEFDKEINAILRNARVGDSLRAGVPGAHLDADAIAAFVEKSLPDQIRRSYMSHFADCTRCRKLLSQTILLNESTAEGRVTAFDGAGEVVAASSIPWYSRLFRTPGLAIAMGALVITFSGVLGYLVFRDSGDANATVSQINEQPAAAPGNGPYFDGGLAEPMPANTNTNAGTTAPATNTAASSNSANALRMNANSAAAAPVDMLATRRQESVSTAPDSTLDRVKTEAQPMAAAPPPVAVTGTAAGADRDKKAAEARPAENEKARVAESKDDSTLSDAARARRDAPVAAAKKGPSRMGPVQSQSNQVGNIAGEMPVLRKAGGKTFENRQGAWYDQAYKGQATQNYRRGTVEYKSLDAGLRSIADTIGGTVVVVWKGRAYRIN